MCAVTGATVIFLHGPPVRTTNLLLEGLSAFAAKHGWRMQCINPPEGAGAIYLRRLVDFWHPLGIICDYGTGYALPRPGKTTGVPFVCIDIDPAARKPPAPAGRRTSGAPVGFVSADADEFVRLAAKELLCRDFESYAYVSSHRRRHWSERRRKAFREIMAQSGRNVHEFNGVNLETGDAVWVQRIGRWLRTLPKPCGLLAANDRMASLVLAAAARHGVTVPDMVSVIGIDNDDILCESLSPPLASIEADFMRGGVLAGQLLSDLAAGRSAGGTALLYGAKGLVRRLSMRRIKRPAPSVRNALEAIRRRAGEGISAADILPILGGSRRSAEKRFKAATGKSILAEIMDVRFEKVLMLLGQRRTHLNMIAGMTGFTSENQLQRQFKARFGMTLSACRKRILADATSRRQD